MDLMQLQPLKGFQGKTLVPEVYGQEEPKSREPILLELSEDSNNPARQAIIIGDYKLIVFEAWKKMLFNIKEDPGEEKDLSEEMPDKVKELEAKLKAEFDKLPVIKPFGGNKLRSGKIATGPKGPPKEADSKKPDEKVEGAPQKE
jgi:hypothetical protein